MIKVLLGLNIAALALGAYIENPSICLHRDSEAEGGQGGFL
jgi:hypothetical protein